MEFYAVFRKNTLAFQGISINHGGLFSKQWKEECLCLYKTYEKAKIAIENRYGPGHEIRKVFVSL